MKLYHYNSERFGELLTRELQGKVTDEQRRDAAAAANFRGDPGPYTDHVSFFMEPAPLDILGSIFPEDHHTWRAGNRLIEHVVETKDLDIYGWQIVETPITMLFLDHLPWYENVWYKRLFFKTLATSRKLFHEQGTDVRGLERGLAKFKPGFSREAYLKIPSLDYYDEIKDMYAATVPHLMIYTRNPIPVSEHRKVVVGNSPLPSMEAWYEW